MFKVQTRHANKARRLRRRRRDSAQSSRSVCTFRHHYHYPRTSACMIRIPYRLFALAVLFNSRSLTNAHKHTLSFSRWYGRSHFRGVYIYLSAVWCYCYVVSGCFHFNARTRAHVCIHLNVGIYSSSMCECVCGNRQGDKCLLQTNRLDIRVKRCDV